MLILKLRTEGLLDGTLRLGIVSPSSVIVPASGSAI